MKLQMTEPYYLIQQQAPHDKHPHLIQMPFFPPVLKQPKQNNKISSYYASVTGERQCKQTNTMIHS